MPQRRRKVPFSGKAKKEQLKLKKHQKAKNPSLLRSEDDDCVRKLNYYESEKNPNPRTNRYALMFHIETDEEIKRRKEEARQCLAELDQQELEVLVEKFFPIGLDFPKRPEWSYDVQKEQLEAKENKYFTEYLKALKEKFPDEELGLFELNLETWRQLWRVIEMSDIVLYIVDIRFSALMFPPSFYEYVTHFLNKQFILVLNKIDLAPAPLVVAWKSYFEEKYPNIYIVMFTTLPGYNLVGSESDKGGLQVRRRRGRIRMAVEGAQVLIDVCKAIVGDDVDLSSWETKVREETNAEFEGNEKPEVGEIVKQEVVETDYYQHEKYKNGILTIGCVGHPNVGKSSLMNAIKGKKIVSVSKTPGHTKHFQTMFLTPNVKFCDCPGLVFPSKVPKTLQVLMGSFPIAQLREPYTTVKYLAERLNIPKLLRIDHPDNDDTWSAMDICDGWAKKRGFFTAKAARPDSYRGANHILRMALDGKICLCLRPPEFSRKIDTWNCHPEVQKVLWIQAKSNDEGATATNSIDSDFSDSQESYHTEDYGTQNTEGGTEDSEKTEDESSDDEIKPTQNKFLTLQK